MFKNLISNDFIALWFNIMFNIFVKASIILIVPLIINLIFKKSAAEFRHLLLFTSISILILLPFLPGPILSFDFPSLQQEWAHSSNNLSGVSAFVSDFDIIDSESTTESNEISNTLMFVTTNGNLEINYYLVFTFLIWLAGSTYLITHLLISIIAVYRIKNLLTPYSDQKWVKTLENSCWDLKLKRPVKLFIGDKFRTPFTFGIINPFIYLPYSSKNYTVEQLKCVLLHELSHIKRGDTITYLIAKFIVALYWFNPLAWLALRLLRLEQEEACDDRVLIHGIKPSAYASLLLNFLKERRPAHPVAALGVSSFKTIKTRIGQILNPVQSRTTLNIKMCITAVTIVAFLTVTVAIFGPTATATEDLLPSAHSKQVEHFQPEQPNNTTPIALKNDTNHGTTLTPNNTTQNTKELKTDVSTVFASDIPSHMPVNGNITAFFGERYHEKFKEERFHSGIDIEAQIGTPVKATASGTVLQAEFAGGYGLMVEIAHQNEHSTVYAHLSSLSVKPGQTVFQGDVIGYSGNTGRTTGPHLHYEIRSKGQPVNPLNFITQDDTIVKPESGKNLSQSQEKPVTAYPDFIKPAPFNKIGSPFGPRTDPITKTTRFHSGIDIPLPIGTPVKASADGQVVKAERYGAYGILVIITHQKDFSTYYAKLSQTLVKAGDTVKQGDIIAYSGNTGRSTGPHLHFEIREQDRSVDPLLLFETLNDNSL